ncbi:MAG: hypothetical protein MJ218_03315 [Opitutales bacterium]|nr:hypothetical protein [Opitutales bacterium]
MEDQSPIDTADYESNSLFYSILKAIVQLKLSNNQLTNFQKKIQEAKDLHLHDYDRVKNYLISSGFVKGKQKRFYNFIILINLIDPTNLTAWFIMADVACDFILLKNLIIKKSASVVSNKNKATEGIEDKLTLK